MPLINCKVELSLKWYENCILSSAGTAATFTITDTKLYVPVVTLKIEDNVKLSKLLNEGFKRLVYWNKCKVILKDYAANNYIREVRKISTGQGNDYTTGCLLNFAYFENNYRLITADLSKQKALDADPKLIQQIIFTGKTDNTIKVYNVLE